MRTNLGTASVEAWSLLSPGVVRRNRCHCPLRSRGQEDRDQYSRLCSYFRVWRRVRVESAASSWSWQLAGSVHRYSRRKERGNEKLSTKIRSRATCWKKKNKMIGSQDIRLCVCALHNPLHRFSLSFLDDYQWFGRIIKSLFQLRWSLALSSVCSSRTHCCPFGSRWPSPVGETRPLFSDLRLL